METYQDITAFDMPLRPARSPTLPSADGRNSSAVIVHHLSSAVPDSSNHGNGASLPFSGWSNANSAPFEQPTFVSLAEIENIRDFELAHDIRPGLSIGADGLLIPPAAPSSAIDCSQQPSEVHEPVDHNPPLPQVTTSSQTRTEEEEQAEESAPQARSWHSEFTLLNFADGDTLVYIDPPKDFLLAEKRDTPGYAWALRHGYPMRLHKDKLLATGSPIFRKAFSSPTYQHRVLRQKHLVGKLPTGVKYVIDLTIPEDGDDAALLCADIMCTPALRHWFMSVHTFNMTPHLVNGLDDDETMVRIDANSQELSNDRPRRVEYRLARVKDGGLPAEFSDVRRHCALERLLYIIENQPVSLDSAPKVWALFCIARYFECLPLVHDLIVTWLYSLHNTFFIEVLPELSLRLAEGFHNENLCRISFAILVGEAAMMGQWPQDNSVFPQQAINGCETLCMSPYGRALDDNLGQMQDAVEHAKLVFSDRICTIYNDLSSCDWFDDWFKEHVADKHPDLPSEISELGATLKLYLQGRLFTVEKRCDTFRDYSSQAYRKYCRDVGRKIKTGSSSQGYTDHSKPRTSPLHPEACTRISHNLPIYMRIFTRSYWTSIRNGICEDIHPHESISTRHYPEEAGRSLVTNELFELSYKINKIILKKRIQLNMDPAHVDKCLSICLGDPPFYEEAGSAYHATNLAFRPKTTDPSSLVPVDLEEDYAQSTSISQPAIFSRAYYKSVLTHNSSQELRIYDENGALLMKNSAGLRAALSQYRVIDEVADASLVSKWEMFSRTPLFNYSRFPEFIDIVDILVQAYNHILDVADDCLAVRIPAGLAITDALCCLDETEWRYLPLWAGGLDDGSGGVFAEVVPDSMNSLGPGRIDRSFSATSSNSGSDFTAIHGSDLSGAQTSLMVMDGYSDTMDHRKVYSEKSMTSTDSFSDLGSMHGKDEGSTDDDSVMSWSETSDATESSAATAFAAEVIEARIAIDNFMLEGDMDDAGDSQDHDEDEDDFMYEAESDGFEFIE